MELSVALSLEFTVRIEYCTVMQKKPAFTVVSCFAHACGTQVEIVSFGSRF